MIGWANLEGVEQCWLKGQIVKNCHSDKQGKIARIKKILKVKKDVTYKSNHNQSIIRHNKTGGLYNHSDPSTYDPTFDTIFNGPSINPCKLVILQIEWCQESPQNPKIKE